MKKVLLLIAMAAFVFACGNTATTEAEGCETKTECAQHLDGEGKVCCKDGEKCEGKDACQKVCEGKERGCGEKKACGEKKEGCKK